MKTSAFIRFFTLLILIGSGSFLNAKNSTWIPSQTSWLNNSYPNTIENPLNLLDNNPATNGYLSMSYWSTLYTKEIYLDFGSFKTIDGFKFAYEFPNTLRGACSSYPGNIGYTCRGNLYYKDQSDQWIKAYECPNLNTIDSSMVCPMNDSTTFTFCSITAREWKFEMAGNYWLGGGFQTTTYYRVHDIYFREAGPGAPLQATDITFSNVQSNQFTFNWADGNGSRRVVFIKQDTTGTPIPLNNTTYTANTSFGSGSQIGTSGWYCVFNGTTHASGVTVTNLLQGNTYRVMVCEYTGSAGAEQYNTCVANNNPRNQIPCGSGIPTFGLVAWYPFNGNANDESGNGSDGVINGAVLTTDRFGRSDRAFYFDGVDDYILVDTIKYKLQNNQVAVSCWFKINEYYSPIIPQHYIFDFRSVGNNLFYLNVDGELIQAMGTQIALSPNTIKLDVWYMMTLTYDGSRVDFYLNKDKIHSASVNPGLDCYQMKIGVRCNNVEFLHGSIDDIRIYNRALTNCEIQTLCAEGDTNLRVSSPNGGEQLKVGSIHPITWTSSNVNNVKIEYSINKGTNWSSIVNDTPASAGSYSWTVPNTPSDLCLVRITSLADATIFDESDATFSIITGSILNNDTIVCVGDTLQLNSRPALTYRWYPSNGLSNDTIQNPILVVDSARTYYLETTEIANNLVDNGAFEQGNTGFTSSYGYSSNLQPQGLYYVTTNPRNTHPGFASCSDHTSGYGNMMVVNGATEPNVSVWSTNISVFPNTDYAFSAYVTNVSSSTSVLAQLQFSINDSTVGHIFSPKPNQCSWSQFFVIWSSGNNIFASINILNQNTIANGNDFALDDISFGEITTRLDSVKIGIVSVDLGPDNYICKGSSLTLDAGGGFDSYVWNTGAKTQTIVVSDSGTYSITATKADCIVTDEILIDEYDLPIVNLGPDKEKFIGQKLLLQSSTGPFSHYFWSTGDTSSSISVTNSGKYWLKATDPWGCVGYDTVEVTNLGAEIRIPNAFTPNGDGYNDYFGPVTEGIETLEMKINDRYGRQVHIIDTVNGRWDGNMLSGSAAPQGVYYYQLKAFGYDQVEYLRQGNVNLYRALIDLTPNPVKDKAVLDMSGRLSGEKIITVYGASGTLIKTWTTTDEVHLIDLSFLKSGLYILKASDSEQTNVLKFIKE